MFSTSSTIPSYTERPDDLIVNTASKYLVNAYHLRYRDGI